MSTTEIESPQSAPAQPLLHSEARRLTDQIRLGLEGVWELTLRAWEGRAWLALGYASWDEYCTRELGSCRVKLPEVPLRETQWRPLAEAGMSHQAIASAVGTSRSRVQEALRAVSPSSRVIGVDGVSKPAVRPTRADVLIRQANAARLRNQGMKQIEIAAELGVTQGTVSSDLMEIDKMTAALDEDVDVAAVLDQSRDSSGRTDTAAVAQRLGVQASPARHLSRLVRQPAHDLEATLRVVLNEVVLADEWLDPAERAAALEVLMPTTARVLEQLRQIVAALTDSDRRGEQWRAVAKAIAALERVGCRR